jgi:hypothetical protein
LGFPPSFQLEIDGKQTKIFTENSAEKFEFSNQCHWKSLLQLTTLSVPDHSLNRETSEIQEVEAVEDIFSTLPLRQFHAKPHWLGDPKFSAQFTVKNVVCFLDIFQ